MTRPCQECKYQRSLKYEEGETGGGGGRSVKSQCKGFHRDIAAEVENDQQESIMKLTQAHEMSAKMIHGTFHENLQLSQKSTSWVTKMLNEEIKKGRVRVCEAIMVMIAATF